MGLVATAAVLTCRVCERVRVSASCVHAALCLRVAGLLGAAEAARPWRSVNGRARPLWSFEAVGALARELFDSFSEELRGLIVSDVWKGGSLVKISVVYTPSRAEIKENFTWLRPLFAHDSASSPSTSSFHFIADVMLQLDELLQSKLFRDEDRAVREARAVTEARNLKRLCGQVKKLTRGSSTSWDDHIAELKHLWLHAQARRKSSDSLFEAAFAAEEQRRCSLYHT